jgi:DNA polymerase-3 subunit alpha
VGEFVGLHNHSEYSVLDGYSSLAQMAQRAVDLGQFATALTDHGDCGGHLVFETECKKRDIKPIFGMEGYLVDSIAKSRAEKQTPKDFSHIVLLAQNQTGLKNLWKLSSRAYIEGFYYKPLADWEMLREHSEGLYATSACLMSYMAMAIKDDNEERINELLGNYLEVFDDRFFLEMHTWQFMKPADEEEQALNDEMGKFNRTLVEISRRFSLPLTVVNDAHYAVPEDWEHHGLIWKMKVGSDQHGGRTQHTGHMMDDEEVIHWMKRHGVDESVTLEAIQNTNKIAQSTDVEIKRGKYIPTLSGSIPTDTEIFYKEIEAGFKRKVIDKGLDVNDYEDRLLYEINTIMDRDFHPYFLMVSDYCRWAKSKGMLVGPGRGSGGGSLVAYILDITELDPVKYNLPFERFMNPGRKTFPDFDLDFPQSRRKEVIEYLKSRYGADKVCVIGTYGRRGPKLILKDLCRALSIPKTDEIAMSKIISKIVNAVAPTVESDDDDEEAEEPTIDINLLLEDNDLRQWVSKYPELFNKIIDMVNSIRQYGVHASGILISTEPLMDLIPLRIIKKKIEGVEVVTITTQFENKTSAPDNMEIEDFGFIKFDILGLRNLDTLTEVNRLVNNSTDPYFFYNFGEAQYRDPEPWKLVEKGQNLGFFQLETSSGSRIAQKFKPTNEYEIADLISVNRPGLTRSGNLDEYLNRRNGITPVTLKHPLLADIVKKTYGMFVYQEQIMFAVQKLANYTLTEADNIRKVMGKKHQEELDALKPEFISRCLANPEFHVGVKNPEAVANSIWNDMEYFGSYAFNMAHALAYGFIGAWSIYMKHYYPLHFMAACLATDNKKEEKVAMYLRDVRRQGYNVLPPDINISGTNFTLDETGIRYGLNSVRMVGSAAVKEIIKKRRYSDFDDFLKKRTKFYVKNNAVENLIKIGAFDTIEPDRAELLYKLWWETLSPTKQKKGLEIPPEFPDFNDKKVILNLEKEIIGNFVTEDPMLPYLQIWEEMSVPNSKIEDMKPGSVVYIGGKIDRIKYHEQKNGETMAFLGFSNDNDEYDLAIFAFKLKMLSGMVEINAPILCKCVLKEYQGKVSLNLLEFLRLDLI